MNRSAALTLINSWTKSPNLLKHMLAVEAALRLLARQTPSRPAYYPSHPQSCLALASRRAGAGRPDGVVAFYL